tara:strand:+ start:3394 stop:4044 length:651 start_codon:yes stop_codon:yes gene_type:complete
VTSLKIEIVSDVVCPWCVIGYKNLQKAIKKLQNQMEFDVSWRPYELHPEIPEDGFDKELYMKQKFGNSSRSNFTSNIKELGESLGFQFNFSKSKTIPNTFKAHRFIWYIKDQELQTKLSEALFYAHFTEGKDIGSTKVLGQIGEDLGLDQKEIIKFLDSKEGGKEVADLEINAMESAITSVPTYIINDRFILHGGQESNTFVSFFKRVETILQKEN